MTDALAAFALQNMFMEDPLEVDQRAIYHFFGMISLIWKEACDKPHAHHTAPCLAFVLKKGLIKRKIGMP